MDKPFPVSKMLLQGDRQSDEYQEGNNGKPSYHLAFRDSVSCQAAGGSATDLGGGEGQDTYE